MTAGSMALAQPPRTIVVDGVTRVNLKTLPVGIQDLYESTITDWGMVMAAGVIITIPALLFFLAVQRYLVAGWGAGGVKG